uniref:Cysteine-rich DPF motif domain-containing protein 1 n=1 Tax=Geotrypetes seraphini TaxID=260995 RepID=A0A6P8RTK2_GEOSA|nr:cysteine-rich DPF motif domain-containing protein 1 isoform X2 [Geotrypetes seraphini]XP_033808892.1 cysteine-rich DPF motif domain-containing protein 1 isoform X2 [Geotrypetes seraphini]XP_033808893.1 cysteine-rich DPF motif domain-containing protein 1 isoform X2 [Geotrypetes seraphini]
MLLSQTSFAERWCPIGFNLLRNMESSTDAPMKGVFECKLCRLTAPYSYYGQKPPNTHSVVLLEECYIIKDPFTPTKDKFLILGSQCSLCKILVCIGPECSLFYSKRFCLPCVNENIEAFPWEIHQDLDRRKAHAKSQHRKGTESKM